MSESSVLLEVRDIGLSSGKLEILQNINFTISAAEIIMVIGPNGGGKTSLAKVIAGILKPSSGEIISKKNLVIGYVPQKIKIEKMIPITVKRFLRLFASEKNAYPILRKFIESENIETLFQKNLYDLSGGQLQRVMLVAALLKRPNLLILDEPVQGLDINGQAEFYELIENLNREEKISIFMISHDLQMVMRKSNQVICLNNHICCQGGAQDILENPIFTELFGNKAFSNIGNYHHHHNHVHNIK